MTKNRTIHDIYEQDRPYEKFIRLGAGSLSDTELLAIILRSGTRGISSLDLARQILKKNPQTGINSLFHLSLKELECLSGIGKVKAIQLKCICEISRRMSQNTARRELNFRRPSSIAFYYMETLRHEETEQVFCMMLDSKNAFIGDECITKGTVNESLLSPREIFIKALAYRAVSIVLVHNHPSGVPAPSRADIEITKRVYEAGALIGITLLDHIIIGNNCFYSIMSEGEADRQDEG